MDGSNPKLKSREIVVQSHQHLFIFDIGLRSTEQESVFIVEKVAVGDGDIPETLGSSSANRPISSLCVEVSKI
jgi:hypothetical protein